jgi:Tfp pilus assembly protein PilF
VTAHYSLSLPRFGRTALARFGLVCLLAFAPAFAARAEDGRPRELTEKTSAALQKLKPLLDAKNWNGALALLESLRPSTAPDSYDLAIITDVEGKIFLQTAQYAKALGPLETSLRLGEKYKYFDASALQDTTDYLARIYFQEAVAPKQTRALQEQYFQKSIDSIKRWLANTTKPPYDPALQDIIVFYAQVLYTRGSMDSAHIDMDLMRQAQAQVDRGLLLAIHPKETLYLLQLAILQQEGKYEPAAKILELLVRRDPKKKDYWPQLAGVYANLAASTKDAEMARDYSIRAILTFERAQAHGFMKTPKDNLNLVSLYYNVGQFGKSTELLDRGLKNGDIEPEYKNWELLAYSYQQIDQPLQAIHALEDATKKFPKNGAIEFEIAKIYYSLNKTPDAYQHLNQAIAKGNLGKDGPVYGFLAYVAFEQQKYKEALVAVQKAIAAPGGSSDTKLPLLKGAIENALKANPPTA